MGYHGYNRLLIVPITPESRVTGTAAVVQWKFMECEKASGAHLKYFCKLLMSRFGFSVTGTDFADVQIEETRLTYWLAKSVAIFCPHQGYSGFESSVPQFLAQAAQHSFLFQGTGW